MSTRGARRRTLLAALLTLAVLAPSSASAATVTVNSTLLAPARIGRAQAERFLVPKPNGLYSDADVRAIVGVYFTESARVGLDPLLALAQMEWETGYLASFWASRPRCNPAGIGVTGVAGAGVVFGRWTPDGTRTGGSIRAHIGRLLAYALKPGTGTAAQRALIAEALRWRSLSAARQGLAPTLKGLAGTWAGDSTYATKLAGVANAMLRA